MSLIQHRPPVIARNRAFTLTELVVVVGISGVLAGLVLPVLGASRASASAARCLHGLRVVGTAFHAYAADHGGAIPPAFDGDLRRPWLATLAGVDVAGKPIGPNYLGTGWDAATASPQGIGCPGRVDCGYAMPVRPDRLFRGLRLAEIAHPAKTAIASDSGHDTQGAPADCLYRWVVGHAPPGEQTYEYPATTHNGGAHYLFADGHVARVASAYPSRSHSPPAGLGTTILFP